MDDQRRNDSLSQLPIVLTSVRDIKIYYELDPKANIRAKLQGIITRVNPKGGIIFFRLYDGTDSIQIIADRNDFNETEWLNIRSIKQSFRIQIESPVGVSKNGTISIILQKVPSNTIELNLDILPEGNKEPAIIGAQIFLSRFRHQASKFFLDQDYLEMEPNFVSVSWASTGLEALEVEYPGFGGPVYLIPSPSPQILRALLVTGKQRMFSISRCFTTSYRDAASSYQSLILCAKEIDSSLDRMISLGESAIRGILSDVSTRLTETMFLKSSWPTLELDWPPKTISLRITSPQIQIFRDLKSDEILKNSNLTLFRICWPPDFVLVEGSAEFLEKGIVIGSLTLHIERMVFLIRSDPTLRLLRHEEIRLKPRKV
jgi:aspartyl/asparaginyl-tRNA synthetase